MGYGCQLWAGKCPGVLKAETRESGTQGGSSVGKNATEFSPPPSRAAFSDLCRLASCGSFWTGNETATYPPPPRCHWKGAEASLLWPCKHNPFPLHSSSQRLSHPPTLSASMGPARTPRLMSHPDDLGGKGAGRSPKLPAQNQQVRPSSFPLLPPWETCHVPTCRAAWHSSTRPCTR